MYELLLGLASLLGWMLLFCGLAMAGLFLLGLALATIFGYLGHALRQLWHFPGQLSTAWWHDVDGTNAADADEKQRENDERLLAQDGIYVDLSRSGPDERSSSQRLARLKKSPLP